MGWPAILKGALGQTLYSSSYDGANNRSSGGAYSGYTYDAANRLTSTSSSSYGYDLDGNMTSETDASSYTYTYDREGRVTGQTGPSLTISYKYDALGRAQTQAIANRYTFTGRERNADGRTMHYRARGYLLHMGRFGQEDPLGMIDGVNLYRYVRNAPCTSVDPGGLCAQQVAAVALGYVGYVAGVLGIVAVTIETAGVGTAVALGAVGAGASLGSIGLGLDAKGKSAGDCMADWLRKQPRPAYNYQGNINYR